MTIHFGKGVLTMTTPDGREGQYEVVNFRFDPVKPSDMVALDIETHVDHPSWSNLNGATDLFAGIDTAADRLSIAVFDGRMRVFDMQKELFREFVVKPFIEEFKIQMATPPKNKPYYRQFEKRGKW